MPREYADSSHEQIRDVIARLQAPIQDLTTLLGLLTPPLGAISLLPPTFAQYILTPLPTDSISVSKHIPLIQRALLEHILPVWGPILEEENCYDVVRQYFAPDIILISLPSAKDLVVYAYDSILSLPITRHSVRLLATLAKTYSIDILWSATVTRRAEGSLDKMTITWEDCVRNIAAVPAKVANILGGKSTTVPAELETGTYFNSLSRRIENLISLLSSRSTQGQLI